MASGQRIRVIEVLMLVLACLIIAAWVVSVLPLHRESSRITVCAANLRGVWHSMSIYSADGDFYPSIFNKSTTGELNLFGYRNRQPLPTDPPSPTADLWMIARRDYPSPPGRHFVCPSTHDQPDTSPDTSIYHDFVGPDNLSYAYVYQYAPGRLFALGTGSNPLLAVMADSNPYLKGNVQVDARVDTQQPGRGNSRNHRAREGQNIAYVDGHVAFVKNPLVGPFSPVYGYGGMPADNIYTTHADGEPAEIGNAPTWTRIQIGSKSDYCLVP